MMLIAKWAITEIIAAEASTTALSDWSVYLWLVFGIIVSFVMPVVRKLITLGQTERAWTDAIRPYLFLAVFSFLAALVILAGIHVKKLQIDSTWGAFLLGYFADATIQKLKP